VRYADEKERNLEARPRLVIGADGISSQVAKLVRAEAYDVRPSKSSSRLAYYSGISIKRVELAWSHPIFVYVFPSNNDLACTSAQPSPWALHLLARTSATSDSRTR
jgi:flavin-dependent dehydrogenase